MKSVKLIFSPKVEITDEEMITDLCWDYLGCLYKNGQILKDYLFIKIVDGYIAFVTIPDDGALDDAHNNIYVSKYLDKIKNHFEIDREIIGENLNTGKTCDCAEKPNWYMLYTDWTDEESPVVCGNCGKSVPLYKLPYIRVEGTNGHFEQEHFSTLSWKDMYRAVDKLWIACLSDRFTFRQMHSLDSVLSKAGRYICKEIEELTGIPFYYYLFNNRRTPSKCPSCGGNWKLAGEKTFIDYKCDMCRLVADEVR
jgi:predicted  nucleic acid-binding Zn ribbon protein